MPLNICLWTKMWILKLLLKSWHTQILPFEIPARKEWQYYLQPHADVCNLFNKVTWEVSLLKESRAFTEHGWGDVLPTADRRETGREITWHVWHNCILYWHLNCNRFQYYKQLSRVHLLCLRSRFHELVYGENCPISKEAARLDALWFLPV